MNEDIQNIIQNISNKNISDSMRRLVAHFKNTNKTPEEIADIIKDFHHLERSVIHLRALVSGDKETAKKIAQANQILKERRISEFKEAVANGTEREFLSTMQSDDKLILEVDMGLSRMGLIGEKPLTEEEQRYADIIKKSIYEDNLRKALSQGFSSVEEWKKHNSSMRSKHGGMID